jgi:hypothetical protein
VDVTKKPYYNSATINNNFVTQMPINGNEYYFTTDSFNSTYIRTETFTNNYCNIIYSTGYSGIYDIISNATTNNYCIWTNISNSTWV